MFQVSVKKWVIVTVLVSLLVLTGVSQAADDVIKTRMRLGTDISTMDPAHLVREYDLALALYSRLMRYEPGSSEIVLDAAEEIEVNEDETEIYFKLKEGIQFHKGYGEMTAEDVKFSFERIIDPDQNSEYAADWETLERVEVIDKYSGKIILSKPFAPLFVTTLPFTPGSIISKKAYEELGDKFATQPVGSGPYYWDEWEPQQKVVLKRFNDYYGEKAEFSKLEVYPIKDTKVAEMNFDRGDLDVTQIALDSVERYEDNPDVDVHVLTPLKYAFIGFNHEHAPFDDIKVRKAARLAIDVDMVIQGVFNGIPERAKGMIAPGILGHWEDGPLYEVDLERAKELLAEAGYPDGLSTTMNVYNDPISENVALIVKENLKRIGMDVDIHVIEEGQGYEFLGKESHPGLLYGSFSLTLDPGYWVAWFTSDQVGKWNYLKWSNEEYDRLAEEAALTMDREKREEMYIKMQKLMDEDVACIWVTHEAQVYVSNDKVDPEFLGHYNQYRYWQKPGN